ncbi:MAG: TonB family protein, partial [Ostreibacterium sp.]
AEEKRKAEAAQKKAEAIAEEKRKAETEANAKKMAILQYSQAIQTKINSRWQQPPKLPPNLRVKLSMKLSSNGEVLGNPRVVLSSGYRVFDNSAIEATKRASPLPLPDKPEWAKEFTKEALILTFP